jgi:hypothetical protein
MRLLLFVAPLWLMGCMRNSPSAQRGEEDKSIVMPDFYDRFPVIVGKQDQLYELDGVTLRALAVAFNDFLPPATKARDCWDTPEAHQLRVIRRGDIIFVEISANPEACGRSMILFDYGAEYAISVDGRILRRRFDGEPNGPLGSVDAGTQEPVGEPVPYNKIGVLGGEPEGPLPAFLRRDGGVSPGRDGGVRPDAGQPDGGVQDGGTSAGP